MTKRRPNPRRSAASVRLLLKTRMRRLPLPRRPRLRPRRRPLLLRTTVTRKKRPHLRKLSVVVSPRLPKTMLLRSPRPPTSKARRRAVLVELLAALQRSLLSRGLFSFRRRDLWYIYSVIEMISTSFRYWAMGRFVGLGRAVRDFDHTI